jgi:hypothetical protein
METAKKIAIDTDTLLGHFNLARLREGATLQEWTAAQEILTEWETQRVEKLYKKALRSADGWNEEELKMKLISLIFDLADIEDDDKIMSFYERPMRGIVENVSINVVCDCILASPVGISTPRTPYFFLQEFKRQKGDSHDPEAQMLAAMLVAQYKNADQKSIFGSWLVGSIWNFTVLEGANYYVSHKYDAASIKDLTKIIFMLRKLKAFILTR